MYCTYKHFFLFTIDQYSLVGFPGDTAVNRMPANAGDTRDAFLIPGLGRSPGEGNGNPLQYSCLGNPMDRGAWQATGSQSIRHNCMTEHVQYSIEPGFHTANI